MERAAPPIRTRRANSVNDDHLANIISGVLLGALVGAGLGLGVCVYIIEGTWLFTGDTVLFGVIICGVLGFLFGEPFIDWLKENWWWFW